MQNIYGFKYTLKNGQSYTPQMKGFNLTEAIRRMNEAKLLFTDCSDFKIVKFECIPFYVDD